MKRRVMMGNRRVTILPYVKSNKSGIDTGVSVGDNIAFQIDFRGYDSTNEQAIFGSWQYDGNIYGVVFMNNRWYYGYGGYNELSVSMPASFTSRQTILYNKSKGFYINGNKIASLGSFSNYRSYPILIFGRSVYSTGGSLTDFPQYFTACYIEFYGCKIWDKDILIRDFYPAKDFEGKICLYEAINNEFYYDINNRLLIDY